MRWLKGKGVIMVMFRQGVLLHLKSHILRA